MRSKKQEHERKECKMIQSFRDIKVYQKSYDVMIELYRKVQEFPKDELYGLTSQIKRASTSIPLNIAEGYGKRENANEFKRFLLMAIGSCDEMKVLLDISKDLGFIDEEFHRNKEQEYDEIGRMLRGLRNNWQ